MKNQKKIGKFLNVSIISLLLVFGYNWFSNNQKENFSQATSSIQLTVSTASSLKDVMEEIETLYEQKHPETDIIHNFASSGSLQRQIEQGAPVDVFISAATKQMDALEKQNLLLTGSRRNLLKNQMALVVPISNKNSNPDINNFDSLTTQRVTKIALGEPKSVPAGKYAQEILTSLKIADQVNSKAVYGKDARQVLNYVATGNVEAGIVYRTDAQVSNQVKIAAIAPESSHSTIIYPIAVIKDSDVKEAATELIEFLSTPEAQAVFEDYGFVSVINN